MASNSVHEDLKKTSTEKKEIEFLEAYLSTMRELVEALRLGYVVMGGIFLCSVLATTVFLERLWFLRRGHVLPKKFLIEIQDYIKRANWDAAETRCRQEDSPFARLLLHGLIEPLAKGTSPEDPMMRTRLEDLGRQEAHRLEGGSEILGTIAGIAPLLGLLGTVIGMIEVFGVISAEGIGNITLLAGGIATALITTVFGIGIAIPSLVAYKFCMNRARSLVLEMEEETEAYLRLIDKEKKAA